MTNDNAQPCLKRIDADCFRAHPAWAKRAFAYRLVHLLTPKPLTKRLPKELRTALLAPGVDLPPGVEMPGGIVVGPGGQIPAGWTPGDPLPPGAIPPGQLPPGVEESGATPPTYTEPWSPGPPRPPSPSPTAACAAQDITESWDACSSATLDTLDTHIPFTADLGTWYAFIHERDYRPNYILTQSGQIEHYSPSPTFYNLVYLINSAARNLHCATNLHISSRRTFGTDDLLACFYDSQPPTGSMLWQQALTINSTPTDQEFTIDVDLSGYPDAHFALLANGYRGQVITSLRIF